MTRLVLGIDVGGTKLAAGLVAADGGIRSRATVPTGAGDAEQLWSRLSGLVDDVVWSARVAAVGIGCGGPMLWPDGRVSPLNIHGWRDFPLRDRMAARFPDVEVRIHNDAVAMALAEHRYGAGRGSRAFLGMVVSTGVGGGLIIEGRVVDGATGNAGHVGHIVVDPDGPPCTCGGVGCLEAVARGPAVVQWALDAGWRPAASAVADGHSLAAAARSGDAPAVAAFERAGSAIGVALASATHLLELDTVAVGGGLASVGDLLLDPARAAFACHVAMPYAATCRILPASLGADGGIAGAAALVMPQHGQPGAGHGH